MKLLGSSWVKQHWSHLFPKLPDRSQFVRQTANIWVVKQQMHQHLVKLLGADTADTYLADGFPMDVCVTTYDLLHKLVASLAAMVIARLLLGSRPLDRWLLQQTLSLEKAIQQGR